jgi:hypothetical protein
MQLDVATTLKHEQSLFDSDTEEDLRGALFMAACQLEGFADTRARVSAPSCTVAAAPTRQVNADGVQPVKGEAEHSASLHAKRISEMT